MAQIPAQFLKSVVTLGWKNPSHGSQPGRRVMSQNATGFLYAYPVRYKEDSSPASPYEARIYLVTCKHVIENRPQSSQLLIRFNSLDGGGMSTYGLDIHREGMGAWTVHPTADIAVVGLDVDKMRAGGVEWNYMARVDHALPHERMLNGDFSEGDEVFILGFPAGWREGSQDYPIVRHGMVAQIKGLANGDHDTFLVDGSAFGGNSGGPVLTKPQAGSIEGTSRIEQVRLVGMVAASTNITRTSDSGPQVQENADLIIVEPINQVNETVELALDAMSSGSPA